MGKSGLKNPTILGCNFDMGFLQMFPENSQLSIKYLMAKSHQIPIFDGKKRTNLRCHQIPVCGKHAGPQRSPFHLRHQ